MKSLKCFKCLGRFASPLKILSDSRFSMLCACLLVLHLFIPEGSKSHFSPVLHAPTLHAAFFGQICVLNTLSVFFILMSYPPPGLPPPPSSQPSELVDLFLLASLPFGVLEFLLLHQHLMTIISYSHKSPRQTDLKCVPSDPI